MTIAKTTLYVGLNDKDTRVQRISTIEAYKVVENLLKAHDFDGATIFESVGLYKHACGEYTTEKSLRIELLFCTKEQVMPLCTALKQALNQESIAVQCEQIESELV